jgi:hypothetical protein
VDQGRPKSALTTIKRQKTMLLVPRSWLLAAEGIAMILLVSCCLFAKRRIKYGGGY